MRFNLLNGLVKKGLLFFSFILTVFFFSCVSNKKVVYIQDEIDPSLIVTDSIMKTYDILNYEYRLQSKDILSLRVSSLTSSEYDFITRTERELGERDPLLSGYVIDEEGFIEIPAIGQVPLVGLTIEEAEEKIMAMLKNYLQNPVVRLKLLNFKVTILGEVNQPGTYSSLDTKLTLMELLARAGDLTEYANRSNLKLIRYVGDEANVIYLNTLDDHLLQSPYFYMKPNDLIVVSPLPIKNLRRISLPTFGIILSTLSALSVIIIRLTR